ncbi:MAG TPA: hypothetical protein VMU34_19090 [Mycobacterium sp.]|nr:hypothetical protein [Mycobacterium sp.]
MRRRKRITVILDLLNAHRRSRRATHACALAGVTAAGVPTGNGKLSAALGKNKYMHQ